MAPTSSCKHKAIEGRSALLLGVKISMVILIMPYNKCPDSKMNAICLGTAEQ